MILLSEAMCSEFINVQCIVCSENMVKNTKTSSSKAQGRCYTVYCLLFTVDVYCLLSTVDVDC